MSSSFREYLEEANLPKEFEIEIDSIKYLVKREYHVSSPRGSTTFPRDSGMSKNKYKIVIGKAINQMQRDDVYSIYWTYNNKNNVISLTKVGNIFKVFGAIMKSTDSIDKLYTKAVNKINLGNMIF